MHRTTIRHARINMLWMLVLGGGCAVLLLVGMLAMSGPTVDDNASTLSMHCAAGLRTPMEAIAKQYEEEYGVRIELKFDGSNSLLTTIKTNKFDTADLYLAADDFYTEQAQELGLAAEDIPIAHMRPVIAVPKNGQTKIKSIEDLLKPGVRVSIANPDQAAVGKVVRERLSAVKTGDSDLWQRLHERVTKDGVFKPTVNEVATDVKIGHVDAGIVWDATAAMPKYSDDLEAIPVAELDGDPNLITLAVLESSRHPTAALKFARYVTARDKGLPIFRKYGTRPVEGDVWIARPKITFFCGAVNRRAVDDIVKKFKEREGVEIDTIYDGCGTLTGRMAGIKDQNPDLGFPDVYMACDIYYLENVKQWFQEAANVSDAELVIAVPKGSDKVKGLADLLEPGVRVSIGEPDHCTLGALTRRLLVKEGFYDELKKKQQDSGEVVVEKVSSALIIPDVTSGNVDAGIAYITDTLANKDKVDIVRIKSTLNVAIQPFSIAKTSQHKYLMRRLFKRIANSPEAFNEAGFHFRLEPNADASSETGNP